VPKDINILILEDDAQAQGALQLMMDGEGWRLKMLGDPNAAMQELAHGSWALVVASLSLVDIASPLFQILKELAQASPVEDGKSRVRVLFAVTPGDAPAIVPVLDAARLPYAMKPYQLNEFMEKVNELLLQAQFLTKTARERGFAFQKRTQTTGSKKGKKSTAANSMFASRDEYYYTEEELAEYEKEIEEQKKKKKLTDRPI